MFLHYSSGWYHFCCLCFYIAAQAGIMFIVCVFTAEAGITFIVFVFTAEAGVTFSVLFLQLRLV